MTVEEEHQPSHLNNEDRSCKDRFVANQIEERGQQFEQDESSRFASSSKLQF